MRERGCRHRDRSDASTCLQLWAANGALVMRWLCGTDATMSALLLDLVNSSARQQIADMYRNLLTPARALLNNEHVIALYQYVGIVLTLSFEYFHIDTSTSYATRFLMHLTRITANVCLVHITRENSAAIFCFSTSTSLWRYKAHEAFM